MDCPYCLRRFDDKNKLAEHSLYCDMNPEVQRTLPDLVGLTYGYRDSLVRIIEVMPGQEYPIYASVLTNEKILGQECWTQMMMTLRYKSVMGQTFGKDKEYDMMAKKMMENIVRTIG